MFIKVHWQNVFNLERHGRVRGPFTLFHLFLFDVCVHYVGKARPTERRRKWELGIAQSPIKPIGKPIGKHVSARSLET